MNQSEMTTSQLTRQKNAGFILPMLLAWFSWFWTIIGTNWVMTSHPTGQGEIYILVGVVWFIYVAIIAYAMGILSAYCWQHQPWDDNTRRDMAHTFSIYFCFFSFPLTIGLIVSVIGIVIIPLQCICYNYGVARGAKWIKTRGIDTFLGRKNDWERDGKN